MYRVGASIFYIRSQLKNPASTVQTANPFSPPRPSAQAMLSSPAKTTPSRYSNVNVPSQSGAGPKYNPTIIKGATENNNTIKPAFGGAPKFGDGSLRSSSGSSDWSDYSQPSQPQGQPAQYGNVPLAWDEPPVQHIQPQAKVFPTIIKPVLASKPSLLPKPGAGSLATRSSVVAQPTGNPHWKNVISESQNDEASRRNYYDDPPDSDFEDELDDSIVSPPMPSEPPPPPPPELGLNNWTNNEEQGYVDSAYGNQGRNSVRIMIGRHRVM